MSDDLSVSPRCPLNCRYCGSWVLYEVEHHVCVESCMREPDDCPLFTYIANGRCSGCSFSISVVRSTGEILTEQLQNVTVDYARGRVMLSVGRKRRIFYRRFDTRPVDLARFLRLGPLS